MAQYAIEDTSLVSIGDALRNYYGDTRIRYETVPGTVMKKVSKTPNALSFTQKSGTLNKGIYAEAITIPGAVKLEIKIAVQTYNTNTNYVAIIIDPSTNLPLALTKGSSSSKVKYYATTTTTEYNEVIEGVDTVIFYCKVANSGNYLGYYAEITGYDENGNLIEGVKEIKEPNTYYPSQMGSAIAGIKFIPAMYKSTRTWHTGQTNDYYFVIDLRSVFGTEENPPPFRIDIKASTNSSSNNATGSYIYKDGVLELVEKSVDSTSTSYWYNGVSSIEYKTGMILLKTSVALYSNYNSASSCGWTVLKTE